MYNYSFTAKVTLEEEIRPEILEFITRETLRAMNVALTASSEKKPVNVEIKGLKACKS